jgi:hypothetical protein
MMKYIEAVDSYDPYGEEIKLFLAGGITGCPNWQQTMVNSLRYTTLTLLNPRRKNFPIDDPGAALIQIAWEYNALRNADAIQFWFPKETLCPIVLYELGAWSMTEKRIFVGVHPEYQRRQDVYIQTGLVRNDVEIVDSIQALADQIIEWDSQR